MGSYNMDSHNCARYVTPEGFVQNEGDVQVSPGGPYRISYQSIVPKAGECPNLLVPVCVSSSHIAYGSIRMEPVFMVLGQSAATAACLAIDDKVDVQKVEYEKLQEAAAGGQAGAGVRRAAARRARSTRRSCAGVVVDDERRGAEGVRGGEQRASARSSAPATGTTAARTDGKQSATLRPDLPAAGKYEVRLSYSPNAEPGDQRAGDRHPRRRHRRR